MKTFKIVLAAVLAATSVWGLGRLREGSPDAPAPAAQKKTKYFCPMHPAIVRDRPDRCPICGMDLQPLEEDAPAAAEDPHAGHGATEEPSSTHAGFKLDAARRQSIGVTTGEVSRRPLERVLRVSGRMAFDPELYSAIEEYRQVRSAGASRNLLRSIETRLRLLGLTDAQIADLGSRQGPPTELLLGQRAAGGDWVYADVYQSELSIVKAGQAVEVETNAQPGRVFKGKVRAVDPVVNPVTRTARVRITLEGAAGLKPETYLDVRIRVPLGERLAVPSDAVLDGGERSWAFVLDGDDVEPRQVSTGRRGEGYVEVVSGLREGETVITSANFLIDSESRLRSAVQAFGSKHAH